MNRSSPGVFLGPTIPIGLWIVICLLVAGLAWSRGNRIESVILVTLSAATGVLGVRWRSWNVLTYSLVLFSLVLTMGSWMR